MSQTTQKINTPDAQFDKFYGLDSKQHKIWKHLLDNALQNT